MRMMTKFITVVNIKCKLFRYFLDVAMVKNHTGGVALIPGSGRFSGVSNGHPLQNSHLENSMNRGPWRVTAHGVTKNRTQLSD